MIKSRRTTEKRKERRRKSKTPTTIEPKGVLKPVILM